MPPPSQYKKTVEDCYAALNARKLNGIAELFHSSCQVIVDGKVFSESRNELMKYFEKELADPSVSMRVVEYLPIDGNKVRAIIEMNKVKSDETYIFSKHGKVTQIRILTDLDK